MRWWEELTATGSEGMVVIPWQNLTRAKRGLVQPGIKVRGREYLRLIYGPNYLEDGNLVRLRQRATDRKRNRALQEYILGLESSRLTAAGGTVMEDPPDGLRGIGSGIRAVGSTLVARNRGSCLGSGPAMGSKPVRARPVPSRDRSRRLYVVSRNCWCT